MVQEKEGIPKETPPHELIFRDDAMLAIMRQAEVTAMRIVDTYEEGTYFPEDIVMDTITDAVGVLYSMPKARKIPKTKQWIGRADAIDTVKSIDFREAYEEWKQLCECKPKVSKIEDLDLLNWCIQRTVAREIELMEYINGVKNE